MPKTSTTYYTSEHASLAAAQEEKKNQQLYIYQCKYTGKHALVTDVSLYALPKRRTDDSSVLDMAEHHTKLYLTEGGVKRIRRTSDGKVEKQFRLVLGDLPVAYTSEQNGKVLYIMKDSVKEYTPKDVTYGERNLPPCIQVIEEGRNVQLLLSVSTTGIKSKIGIYNIFDSRLKVKLDSHGGGQKARKELLEMFSQALDVKVLQLTLVDDAEDEGLKVLQVGGRTALQVFKKLKAFTKRHKAPNQNAGGPKKY